MYAFWHYVSERTAGDNPRGNIIRAVKASLDEGVDPTNEVRRLCSDPRAAEAFQKLIENFRALQKAFEDLPEGDPDFLHKI